MYYTIQDLMELLHISRNTAYKIAHMVGAPTIRVGGKLLLDKEKFDLWSLNWSLKRPTLKK